MIDHVNTLREQFEQLRPHIRPEADQIAGAMAVALDQAAAAAAAEPAPASPIDEQLAAIAADVKALREGAGL